MLRKRSFCDRAVPLNWKSLWVQFPIFAFVLASFLLPTEKHGKMIFATSCNVKESFKKKKKERNLESAVHSGSIPKLNWLFLFPNSVYLHKNVSTSFWVNNNSLSLSLFVRLCFSDNILQPYKPAVQHHLRILHWGHLSSHDGLQHVSYHHRFASGHRSPAQARSGASLVNSSRNIFPSQRGIT